jgi:hypothetical protein
MLPVCAERPALFSGHVLVILLPANKSPDLVQACSDSVQRNFEFADNLSDVPKQNRKH